MQKIGIAKKKRAKLEWYYAALLHEINLNPLNPRAVTLPFNHSIFTTSLKPDVKIEAMLTFNLILSTFNFEKIPSLLITLATETSIFIKVIGSTSISVIKIIA